MKKIIKVILIIILIVVLINSVKKSTEKIYNINKIKDTINDLKIGKIEIPSISVNNKIISRTDSEILDQNYVGHIKESSLNFDETIILAGHNNKAVFKNLKYLKKNDEIFLTIKNESKKYCVLNNIEIDKLDYTYFKNIKNTLILITCTNNKNKRLIIISKICV